MRTKKAPQVIQKTKAQHLVIAYAELENAISYVRSIEMTLETKDVESVSKSLVEVLKMLDKAHSAVSWAQMTAK